MRVTESYPELAGLSDIMVVSEKRPRTASTAGGMAHRRSPVNDAHPNAVSVCCPACSHRFVTTPEARFWGKVIPPDDRTACWEWDGVLISNGYAMFQAAGMRVLAHRFSYELHIGEIPQGLVIDHLCRNRRCVNPDHLEAVTQAENARRGNSPPALAAQKDHCMRGHLYTTENTILNAKGWRTCRTCRTMRQRARRQAA